MTASKIIAIFSTLSGASGSLLLYLCTYSLKPGEGGVFFTDAIERWNLKVKERNRRRTIGLRIGSALLGLSFSLQALSIFLN